jgi:hypothetical protein
MLDVTWLRLAEEVICYAMSQQACKLLLWDTSLLGKLIEGYSGLERNQVLNIIFEDGLHADRGGKLFGSADCLATTRSLITYRLGDYGLNWPLVEPP